jgi:hypothetical protein
MGVVRRVQLHGQWPDTISAKRVQFGAAANCTPRTLYLMHLVASSRGDSRLKRATLSAGMVCEARGSRGSCCAVRHSTQLHIHTYTETVSCLMDSCLVNDELEGT